MLKQSSAPDSFPDQIAYNKNKVFAARFLGISASSLDRLIISGDGPRYLRVRKQVRFSIADLVEWADKRKAASILTHDPMRAK